MGRNNNAISSRIPVDSMASHEIVYVGSIGKRWNVELVHTILEHLSVKSHDRDG
jgi:hypothetical protein